MARSAKILQQLRQSESRNVTWVEPDGSWPIVWDRAKGVFVWDVNGKKYLDLTAAFGVAAAGHSNPRVIRAAQKQAGKLLHAMGDVHPHAVKAQLARELSRLTFERWTTPLPSANGRGEGSEAHTPSKIRQSFRMSHTPNKTHGKIIFCNSGFEAVEAALKTALLCTGKPGVIAFEGAYHGTGYGTLNTTHRDHFSTPFSSQLRRFGHFVAFPTRTVDLLQTEKSIEALFRRQKIGAILVEPIQGRAGIRVPAQSLLPLLREWAGKHNALLILDEIYTGFGRTGKWFACEHSGTVPDIICLGKALTGGFPLSACVGRVDVMDAWPQSTGEAIHTSTFSGHPVGCAMALAQLAELATRNLVQRSARLGVLLLELLRGLKSPHLVVHASGLGLMAGCTLSRPDGTPATEDALRIVKGMLERGLILLPEGHYANVLSFTPPLGISEAQINLAVDALRDLLQTLQ